MSVRLGVVADDLTGANAVGAQLAEMGLPSVVTADPAALATVPAPRSVVRGRNTLTVP